MEGQRGTHMLSALGIMSWASVGLGQRGEEALLFLRTISSPALQGRRADCNSSVDFWQIL